MDSDKFCVEFNGGPVFQPGTEVAGLVLLRLSEPMKARTVKIAVDGRASTHWSVQENYTTTDSQGRTQTHSRSVSYSATVVYLSGESIAWSPGSTKLLESGEHRFPFRFLLPAVCPPSYEGCYGHIRYECKVTIDRPWRFDPTASASFLVCPIVDLNLVPSLALPAMTEVSKDLGMVFFRHGRLSMQVSLPKRGFVPGEDLAVQVFVKNSSSREVKSLEVQLLEHSHYAAYRGGYSATIGHTCRGNESRANTKVVTKIEEEVTVSKESDGRFVRCLRFPWTAPSFDASLCAIIQVDYQIKVKLKAHGRVGNKLTAFLPVSIGTVPLRGAAVAMPAPVPSAVVAPSAPPEAPPSYEESLKEPQAYGFVPPSWSLPSAPSTSDSAPSAPSAPPYPPPVEKF